MKPLTLYSGIATVLAMAATLTGHQTDFAILLSAGLIILAIRDRNK